MHAVVLAALVLGAPRDLAREEPGHGIRWHAEGGVSWFSGSLSTSAAEGATAGVDGVGIGLRYGVGIDLVPGFVLGAGFAVGEAFPSVHSDRCCDGIDRVTTFQGGPELDWYPSPTSGFHARLGFGVAYARVHDAPNEGVYGPTWTVGILRDFAIGHGLRAGFGVLLDVASLRSSGSDPTTRMNTLVPTLAGTIVSY